MSMRVCSRCSSVECVLYMLLPLLDHLHFSHYKSPTNFFYIFITAPVESVPFFVPSTSSCSLSFWFTSSCSYHFITVPVFTLVIYLSLCLSLPSDSMSLSPFFSFIVCWFHLNCLTSCTLAVLSLFCFFILWLCARLCMLHTLSVMSFSVNVIRINCVVCQCVDVCLHASADHKAGTSPHPWRTHTQLLSDSLQRHARVDNSFIQLAES